MTVYVSFIDFFLSRKKMFVFKTKRKNHCPVVMRKNRKKIKAYRFVQTKMCLQCLVNASKKRKLNTTEKHELAEPHSLHRHIVCLRTFYRFFPSLSLVLCCSHFRCNFRKKWNIIWNLDYSQQPITRTSREQNKHWLKEFICVLKIIKK